MPFPRQTPSTRRVSISLHPHAVLGFASIRVKEVKVVDIHMAFTRSKPVLVLSAYEAFNGQVVRFVSMVITVPQRTARYITG